MQNELINGIAAGLATALSKDVMEMPVIGIEATYESLLKVWVGEICKVC